MPGAHWLERLPVPSSAELSSGLGRAVGAEGCLGSVQACPQTRGAPRPRASPGEQLLSFLSASGLGSAQQRPCRIPAATVLPPSVLVVLGSVLFYVDLLSFL